MRVRDVMTYGAIGVPDTATLAEAIETMLRSRQRRPCWIEPNSGFYAPRKRSRRGESPRACESLCFKPRPAPAGNPEA